MPVPEYCDDCDKKEHCGIRAQLQGLKIKECTNKNYEEEIEIPVNPS